VHKKTIHGKDIFSVFFYKSVFLRLRFPMVFLMDSPVILKGVSIMDNPVEDRIGLHRVREQFMPGRAGYLA
jgi:hypothetical protein